MHILYAYCEELDEVVTIDEARRRFACEDPPLKKYHFYCDDPLCQEPDPVAIIGVNYKVSAAETEKHVAAHFREHHKHHPQCQWMAEDDETINPDETAEDARQRRIRRKLSDLVNVFDPNDDRGDMAASSKGNASAILDNFGDQTQKTIARIHSPLRGDIKTTQLERLAESYREAKKTLTEEEFQDLDIKIIGQGNLKLVDYFCHIARASMSTTDRVIFGGAKLIDRYGTGFKFKFFDKLNSENDVFLYIDRKVMDEYRYRKYIDRLLAQSDDVRYFNLFFLGRFKPGKTEGRADIEIESLRHLAIFLGPEKVKESPAVNE